VDRADLAEIFKDIVEADQRADKVIRNLRSLFTKGEADHRTLRLDALVREVVSLVASDAQLRNVSIRLDLASDAPPVTGDRVQLQQVLLNLLVNAFDAMADVTDRPREVTVTARPLGSTVQVDVADTGPGIAPDTLASLFEPFVTTKRGGMGMGLAVSRSIVRAHQGRLWADNNPGGGATFHIVLPAAPADATDRASPYSMQERLPNP
jgi:two-component system sensor kinase FixL